MARKSKPPTSTLNKPVSKTVGKPSFAQAAPTPDPTIFEVKHASDNEAYKEIDQLNKEHKIKPLPFHPPRGLPEPILTLQQVLGDVDDAPPGVSDTAKQSIKTIQDTNKQIVFHALGDCGSTKGPKTQNEVVDKMLADFDEAHDMEVPKFHFLLGDVVYSFGEAQYYFDQFYDAYRDYPAPILAAPGNHDGMVSPLAGAISLDAFYRNFCAERFVITPEAGGLTRTAQIQPGVFFTFEAPFVRILAIYSNTLEDPGVIADGNYTGIGNSQVTYLETALKRAKGFPGAVLIADHHPPYTVSRHGWSVEMLKQIDDACKAAGFWPHAFLSGHAHNYQRFTRTRGDGTQIPYIVCGNGGHGLQTLSKSGALRAPQIIQNGGDGSDQVVLESYDDKNYGYLRLIVDDQQLRIEYHPASDGGTTKTPDDSVTVNLRSRKLVHYTANDLGHPARREAIADAKDQQEGRHKRKK